MLQFSILHQSITAPCSGPCALPVLPAQGVCKELVALCGNKKCRSRGAAHITGAGS